MMKILLICEAVFPENKGGLERWMVYLAEQLVKRGNEVVYLNSANLNFVRNGVQYQSVTKHVWSYKSNGTRSIFQAIKFGLGIKKYLNKNENERIYAVQAPILSLFFIEKFRSKNSKLVIEWIEIWSYKYWHKYLGTFLGTLGYLIQVLALRLGDIRVVFSQICANVLNSNSINSPTKLLPGLVMEDLDSRVLNKLNHRENIVFLGRLVEEKQPLFALDIIREYKIRGWKGVFIIIGTGPLEESLKRHVKATSMEEYVKFKINISDEEKNQLILNAMVLLHPSKREGYGLAMIEAAQLGTPTILLNYPENNALSLQPIPYLNTDPEINKVVNALDYCFSNQSKLKNDLSEWVKNELPKKSALNSVIEIEELFNEKK